MPHTYKFLDAKKLTVVRDDGVTFPWPGGDANTPAQVGANLGGFVGEDYRTDGCPAPLSHTEKLQPARSAEDVIKEENERRMSGGKRLSARAPRAKGKAKQKRGSRKKGSKAKASRKSAKKAARGKKPTKHGR